MATTKVKGHSGINAFKQRVEGRPWFEAGQPLDGQEAERYLEEIYQNRNGSSSPYCIYVHIPFCATICSFCALYTHAIQQNFDSVFDEFLEMIQLQVNSHKASALNQPPTTVHFGGGTPLHIGMNRFKELTDALRNNFGDSDTCEWAIETTTSSITRDILDPLEEMRIQRIHLGIQTLNNEIRRHIGRHEQGEIALEKIRLLRAKSFFLSIDLIIGFEQSTESIVWDDLCQLYDAGIRMFSICELRHRRKTPVSDEQLQNESRRNYRFWEIIWQFMEDHDLIPIHLGQFARTYEDNLYFTHPARNEDCIAIGPYAHGSVKDLYYGNKLLPDYYDSLRKGKSPIGIALKYNHEVQVIRDLEKGLLAHRISESTINNMRFVYPTEFNSILDHWLAHSLIREFPKGNGFCLSKEGSWFVGNMITQLRQLVRQTSSGS
ncbi:MAG: radical SAM protein [Bryobacterales bacterium]